MIYFFNSVFIRTYTLVITLVLAFVFVFAFVLTLVLALLLALVLLLNLLFTRLLEQDCALFRTYSSLRFLSRRLLMLADWLSARRRLLMPADWLSARRRRCGRKNIRRCIRCRQMPRQDWQAFQAYRHRAARGSPHWWDSGL